MLGTIIPIFLFGSAAFFMSVVNRSKFGSNAWYVMASATLIIFASGIVFDSFRPGLAILLCAYIAFAFSAILAIGKNRISPADALSLTGSGAMAYLLLSGLTLAVAMLHGADPVYWDEVAHWGQMTKELLRLDTFYTSGATTLMFHNDYPPAIPLWEALFCMLSGGFDGRATYAALWLFQIMLFLPLFDGIECTSTSDDESRLPLFLITGRNVLIAAAVLILLLLLCIPCFDKGTAAFWKSLYVDTALGASAGLGAYVALVEEPDAPWAIRLAVLAAFITLIKQSALFFSMAIGIIWLVRVVRNKTVTSIICALGPICVVGLVSVVWKSEISSSPIDTATSGQFSMSLSDLMAIPAIASPSCDGYQHDVLSQFISALFEKPLVAYCPLPTPFAILLIVSCAITYLVFRYSGYPSRYCVVVGAMQFSVGLLYAIAIGGTYLFAFSEAEATKLACFERYINTFIVSCQTLNTIVFLHAACSKKNTVTQIMLIVLLLVGVAICPDCLKQFQIGNNSRFTHEKQEAQALTQYCENSSHVFIIDTENGMIHTLAIAYYADDRVISRETETYGLMNNQPTSPAIPREIMAEFLRDEQYIYARTLDPSFDKVYGSLFSNRFKPGTLYKVFGTSDDVLRVREIGLIEIS